MPTERIGDGEAEARHRPDLSMLALVADYLRHLGLNPDRLVLQAGWLGHRYVLHIRFPDLTVPSANNSQMIHLTVEHALDLDTGDDAIIIAGKKELLLTWVLERCYETLSMAHAEWVQQRKHQWPAGMPTPDYQMHRLALEKATH